MSERVIQAPVSVVYEALYKGWIEYRRMLRDQDADPAAAHECWAEFESLAEWLPVDMYDELLWHFTRIHPAFRKANP